MDKKVKVSIETVNETKYFTMSCDAYWGLLNMIDNHPGCFIRIPGTNVVINTAQIVYIYHREISESEII